MCILYIYIYIYMYMYIFVCVCGTQGCEHMFIQGFRVQGCIQHNVLSMSVLMSIHLNRLRCVSLGRLLVCLESLCASLVVLISSSRRVLVTCVVGFPKRFKVCLASRSLYTMFGKDYRVYMQVPWLGQNSSPYHT